MTSVKPRSKILKRLVVRFRSAKRFNFLQPLR